MDYRRTYAEYEELVAAFPMWSLDSIKSLSVRERRHWHKWAQVRLSNNG